MGFIQIKPSLDVELAQKNTIFLLTVWIKGDKILISTGRSSAAQ